MPLPPLPALRLLVAAAALATAATACGSDSSSPPEADAPTVSVTPSETSSPTAATSSPTTSAPASSSAATATFSVKNGKVRGPSRITAKIGDKVTLSVTADTSDEVHVHGYDVTARVRPGKVATVRVRADIPGVFEIELEDSHLLLTQLRVTQ